MSGKPSDREDEYFARIEFERLKKLELERQSKLEATEKDRLKELHHMCCPKCGMQLVAIDYKGVEVDKCSNCDGIWLDAGELEALEAVSETDKGILSNWFANFKK